MIRRSYQHRREQTIAIDMRDDEDPQHAIDNHFAAFDNDLMMFGEVIDERDVLIDDDDLRLEVVEGVAMGRVLPFKPRGGTP